MAKKRRRPPVSAPAAAPAPAPAAPTTGAGKGKPRAAVAAPPKTEAQQHTYFTKHAKGLLKHAANFDASSGDGVMVFLAIVGAPSSSRMGAQKAAMNVTAEGQGGRAGARRRGGRGRRAARVAERPPRRRNGREAVPGLRHPPRDRRRAQRRRRRRQLGDRRAHEALDQGGLAARHRRAR